MNFAYILIFWVLLQAFGLLGLPWAFRLFQHLPDRGYAFTKPLGLLLTGYTLWALGSLGLLRNNLGGTLLAIGLVLILGLVWYRQRHAENVLTWVKTNRTYVLTVESIFTLALIAWTIFKAYNPNIETAGGEKWMEIAFINANLLSTTFPPQDPWLSGFGISYYYFGYVFMALLVRLSGIVSTTAFNLLIPTLFSLTLTSAYGLIVNLVVHHQNADQINRSARLYGLFGPLFVGVLGHWEGVLEVLHSRGLLPARFWAWLDIINLREPPIGTGPWIPDRFIWWWRSSRVLVDYDLAGIEQENIDEMPIFSFLLGDVHPHVLTLPFVLLVVALALNLFLRPKVPRLEMPETPVNLLTRSINRLTWALDGKTGILLYALCAGALGFLNTWDFPIYLAILGLAYLFWSGRTAIFEVLVAMSGFAVLGGLLYLPFYAGFQSQAGGIMPNLWNPTRLPQFFVFFGPFLVIIIGFMTVLSGRIHGWQTHLRWSIPVVLVGAIAILTSLTLLFFVSPAGRGTIDGLLQNTVIQEAIGGETSSALLQEILRRRLANPWTFLLLGSLVGWSLAHLWSTYQTNEQQSSPTLNAATAFVLILLLVGLLLPLSVEFVFLRDNFGRRMNTIFKFYFQAWVLLALVSAFGAYYASRTLAQTQRLLWHGGLAIIVLSGLIYPILAIRDKANYFNNEPTLDGIAWVAQHHPDDHAAILWLRQNASADAVILEAPGAGFVSYHYDARISTLTGRPTLLGWGGHQHQWRGNYEEPARREPDIELLYNGLDLRTTLTLLDKYNIKYVYVGPLERQRYQAAGLNKFERLLDVAFQQGAVVIYQRLGQDDAG